MEKSSDEISYFKIGSFVLVGIGLIIFAILVFGSGKLFQPIVHVETYFEESIQGVSVGTPVKYRGLQIGYIEKIAFTSEIYRASEAQDAKFHNRSIYVKIAITSELFTKLTPEKVNELLAREVAQGLRIKLVAQGLTGTSYLELDYADLTNSPSIAVTWQPENFYIPSSRSTLTRLSENAQYVMNEIKDINFKKIFADIDTLTNSINRVAEKTDNLLGKVDKPLAATLESLNISADNFRSVSERIKLNPAALLFGAPPKPLDPSKL